MVGTVGIEAAAVGRVGSETDVMVVGAEVLVIGIETAGLLVKLDLALTGTIGLDGLMLCTVFELAIAAATIVETVDRIASSCCVVTKAESCGIVGIAAVRVGTVGSAL